jgi:HEAT repeat protein
MRSLFSTFIRVLFVLLGMGLCIRLSAQESPRAKPEEPEIIPGEACLSTFDRLISSLQSKESMVRVAAAECLEALGDKRAVGPLVRARFAEEYPRYVQVYENALRAINDPRTADLLLAALESPKTKWAAAWSLGRLQITSAVEPLLKLLNSNDIEDRRTAAESLGPMKDNRAVGPLCAALNGQDEVLRRYAANALGQIGDASAVESLISALLDSDDGVRWNAANSLGDVRDASAVEPLARALGDDDENVQKAAADALGKIGDSRAAKALAASIKSGNRAVQWHSAAALAEIRDPQGDQALDTSLKEGKLTVVAAAYPFFVRKGDAASISVLIQALNEHGDLGMVRGLMFCGNSQLEDAARDWAKRNKMEDLEPPEEHLLVWGSER